MARHPYDNYLPKHGRPSPIVLADPSPPQGTRRCNLAQGNGSSVVAVHEHLADTSRRWLSETPQESPLQTPPATPPPPQLLTQLLPVLPVVPPAVSTGPAASMSAVLSETSVRSVISRVLPPNVSIEHVGFLPSTKLQRLYGIKTSDGAQLALAVPPPRMARLLRFEQWSLSSEAAVLRFLSDYRPPTQLLTPPARRIGAGWRETTPRPSSRRSSPESGGSTPKASAATPRADGQSRSRSETPEVADALTAGESYLAPFVPTLMLHGSAAADELVGTEHNIVRTVVGTPIIARPVPLTANDRKAVDWQMGHLCQAISRVTEPSDKFGPAVAVLAPASSSQSQDPTTRYVASMAKDSWSEAFHNLLENILRDGEDMAVTLGYSTIRRHFDRFGHFLDSVTTPRLVVVDAWEDTNILVCDAPSSSPKAPLSIASPPVSATSEKEEALREAGKEKAKECSETQDTDGDRPTSARGQKRIVPEGSVKVVGLREWSNAVFGDPLFTAAFSQEPSAEFVMGFNSWFGVDGSVVSPRADLIEDRHNAHIRLLLYDCYHATVGVVREFYRPKPDSSKRELAARKRLNDALARLEEIDDEILRRRRRPSGEMSPAKRPKQDFSESEDEHEVEEIEDTEAEDEEESVEEAGSGEQNTDKDEDDAEEKEGENDSVRLKREKEDISKGQAKVKHDT